MKTMSAALALATPFGAGDALVIAFVAASAVLGLVLAGVLLSLKHDEDNEEARVVLGAALNVSH